MSSSTSVPAFVPNGNIDLQSVNPSTGGLMVPGLTAKTLPNPSSKPSSSYTSPVKDLSQLRIASPLRTPANKGTPLSEMIANSPRSPRSPVTPIQNSQLAQLAMNDHNIPLLPTVSQPIRAISPAKTRPASPNNRSRSPSPVRIVSPRLPAPVAQPAVQPPVNSNLIVVAPTDATVDSINNLNLVPNGVLRPDEYNVQSSSTNPNPNAAVWIKPQPISSLPQPQPSYAPPMLTKPEIGDINSIIAPAPQIHSFALPNLQPATNPHSLASQLQFTGPVFTTELSGTIPPVPRSPPRLPQPVVQLPVQRPTSPGFMNRSSTSSQIQPLPQPSSGVPSFQVPMPVAPSGVPSFQVPMPHHQQQQHHPSFPQSSSSSFQLPMHQSQQHHQHHQQASAEQGWVGTQSTNKKHLINSLKATLGFKTVGEKAYVTGNPLTGKYVGGFIVYKALKTMKEDVIKYNPSYTNLTTFMGLADINVAVPSVHSLNLNNAKSVLLQLIRNTGNQALYNSAQQITRVSEMLLLYKQLGKDLLTSLKELLSSLFPGITIGPSDFGSYDPYSEHDKFVSVNPSVDDVLAIGVGIRLFLLTELTDVTESILHGWV